MVNFAGMLVGMLYSGWNIKTKGPISEPKWRHFDVEPPFKGVGDEISNATLQMNTMKSQWLERLTSVRVSQIEKESLAIDVLDALDIVSASVLPTNLLAGGLLGDWGWSIDSN